MEDIEIVNLSPCDWKYYKELRLKALKANPEAFGLTYEEALKKSDEEWKERLERSIKGVDHWRYFAKLNSELVGIVSGWIIESEPQVVKVGEVFVAEKARNKGIGRTLLVTLLNKLSERVDLKKARIKVFTPQKDAISLYKSVGFEIVDKIKEEFLNRKSEETFIMEKNLHS